MRSDYRVFLDACVLANFGVCDLLLRLSERPRLIVPHWSTQILEEVRRTHEQDLEWPPHLVESFQQEIQRAFPEACVTGYEHLIPVLTNDEKDRHVLAAAIRGDCPLILTFNLKHFPAAALAPWSVCASHPQDYLLVLYEMDQKQVMGCLGEIAGRRKLDIEDVLIRLGKVLPVFSQRMLDDLEAQIATMDFLVAVTFTDSLSKLTGDEQKAAKTTAFDLKINPTNPGQSFHRLDNAKDKKFWSVRVAEPLALDPQPVQKLIRATKKALPLLDFCAWSTAQLNPWMHHLLAQPVMRFAQGGRSGVHTRAAPKSALTPL